MPPSRRQDLIDAAARVFHQEGFHAVGLDRILHEAGVSRMTLYHHFASKDDLIVAALARQNEEYHAQILGEVERLGGGILAVFDAHAEAFAREDFPGCMFIKAAGEYPALHSRIHQAASENKRAIRELFRVMCERAGVRDAKTISSQLSILLNGAFVLAQAEATSPTERQTILRDARKAAAVLLEAAHRE